MWLHRDHLIWECSNFSFYSQFQRFYETITCTKLSFILLLLQFEMSSQCSQIDFQWINTHHKRLFMWHWIRWHFDTHFSNTITNGKQWNQFNKWFVCFAYTLELMSFLSFPLFSHTQRAHNVLFFFLFAVFLFNLASNCSFHMMWISSNHTNDSIRRFEFPIPQSNHSKPMYANLLFKPLIYVLLCQFWFFHFRFVKPIAEVSACQCESQHSDRLRVYRCAWLEYFAMLLLTRFVWVSISFVTQYFWCCCFDCSKFPCGFVL